MNKKLSLHLLLSVAAVSSSVVRADATVATGDTNKTEQAAKTAAVAKAASTGNSNPGTVVITTHEAPAPVVPSAGTTAKDAGATSEQAGNVALVAGKARDAALVTAGGALDKAATEQAAIDAANNAKALAQKAEALSNAANKLQAQADDSAASANAAGENQAVAQGEVVRTAQQIKEAQDLQAAGKELVKQGKADEQVAKENQTVAETAAETAARTKAAADAQATQDATTAAAANQSAATTQEAANKALEDAKSKLTRFESVKQHVLTYKKSYAGLGVVVAAVGGYLVYDWYKTRQARKAAAKQRVEQTIRTYTVHHQQPVQTEEVVRIEHNA